MGGGGGVLGGPNPLYKATWAKQVMLTLGTLILWIDALLAIAAHLTRFWRRTCGVPLHRSKADVS